MKSIHFVAHFALFYFLVSLKNNIFLIRASTLVTNFFNINLQITKEAFLIRNNNKKDHIYYNKCHGKGRKPPGREIN